MLATEQAVHARTKHADMSMSLAWQTAAIFILALLIRVIGISSNPVHGDELYHLIAGKSWAEDGSFRMLDGEYLRARGFTALTGLMFELTGREDLFVARLPSVLSGSILVAALFYWLSREVNQKAGWLGALMFCFTSYAITVTQFARFYALQAMLVWLIAIAVYSVTSKSTFRDARWLLISAGLMAVVALHLQVSTGIALMALGLWVLINFAARPAMRGFVRKIWADRKARVGLIAAVILLLAIVVPVVGMGWQQFRYTPQWALPQRNNVMFYFMEFAASMPVLWLFLPVATAAALSKWPRPALFCVVMVAVPIALHSLGGMKEARYVFYTLPFLFALWGMAMANVLPRLVALFEQGMHGLERGTARRFPAHVLNAGVVLLLCTAFAGVLISTPAYRQAFKTLVLQAKNLLHDPVHLAAAPPDIPWTGQVNALRQAIGHPSVLMVGDDFHALAYLGPYDVLINSNRVVDLHPPGEFVMDARTGRRAIALPESVEKVIACYPDGAVVVPDTRWRNSLGIAPATADRLEGLTVPATPAIPGFHVFKWQTPYVSQDCGDIRAKVTGDRR